MVLSNLNMLYLCFMFLILNLKNNVTCFRFKFDDERVTKEDTNRALEEQYGGEEEVIFCLHLFGFTLIFCFWYLLSCRFFVCFLT